MNSHPFSPADIEAAAKAVADISGCDVLKCSFCREIAAAALSTAFEHARGEGRVKDDLGHKGRSGAWHIGINSGEGTFPVTIIKDAVE